MLMTWFARFLLVLTSLAPIAVVYSAVLFDQNKYRQALSLACGALFCFAFCWALLASARRQRAPDRFEVKQPAEREGDALSFLVAYAVPLAVAKSGDAPSALSLAAFTLVMTLLLWQQQIFHVNPLLGAVGYHFFSARADDGSQVLVLTKSKTLTEGDLPIIKLSAYLWLHCS